MDDQQKSETPFRVFVDEVEKRYGWQKLGEQVKDSLAIFGGSVFVFCVLYRFLG